MMKLAKPKIPGALWQRFHKSKPGNWIQGAIKHPGALHAQMGIPAGKKIPKGRLRAAAKKGGKLGRRANLALTLSKMHKESKAHERRESASFERREHVKGSKNYEPRDKKKHSRRKCKESAAHERRESKGFERREHVKGSKNHERRDKKRPSFARAKFGAFKKQASKKK